jgi:hypothetical protein
MEYIYFMGYIYNLVNVRYDYDPMLVMYAFFYVRYENDNFLKIF